MPKHIRRLVLLLVGFAAVAYGAKRVFTADSFYLYGHYRGKSVEEIAGDKPKFKGSAYCQACHAQVYAEWSKGAHRNAERGKAVQCEVCHGAAGRRDAGGPFEHVATGVDHPASGKLAVPRDSLKICPVCHEKIAGRPPAQPQVVIGEHAGAQQCTSCHNPHSPKTVRLAAAAATTGKAALCSGCHGADGVSANPAWPNLAGQQSAYLVDALKAYKDGARANPMMAAAVKGLGDRDIREIAEYYARVSRRGGKAANGAPAASPPESAACGACHGANGKSANPAWPHLAGQQKDYLVAALRAYRAGTRKSDAMSGMAKGLSDARIEALAAYYASLP